MRYRDGEEVPRYPPGNRLDQPCGSSPPSPAGEREREYMCALKMCMFVRVRDCVIENECERKGVKCV